MHNTKLRRRWILGLILLMICSLANAQQWNPNHKIGTVTGVDHFAPGQTPDQLVEIFPAAIPNTGLTYQWWYSDYPTTGFTAIGGATSPSFTLSAGQFNQTKYLKRVTTYGGSGPSIESNVVKLTMVSANWEDINYIREYDVKVTGVTTWQAVDQLAIGSKLQTTSYVDGLGRSTQNVSKGTATPVTTGGTWGDLVEFSEYDQYGREVKNYLSYSTTSQPGKFKALPVADQASYYSTKYGEASPFNAIVFETSPLNRIENLKKPGISWNASAGISAAYELNTTTDDVRLFKMDYVQGNAPIYVGAYPENTLYKLTTTDETGKKTVEYLDNSGRTVLKKVQLDDTPSDAYTGWICTYSIYDDFGFLRCLVQPEGVKHLKANGWSFTTTVGQEVLAKQCFQYFYDEKGRVIWKKTPGNEPLLMVYDKRNRLALTQDGNQRNLNTPQWTSVIYDELDRPVIKALYNASQTTANLRTSINVASTTSSVTIANPGNIGAGTSITLTTSLNFLTSTDLNNTTASIVLSYHFYDNYSFNGVKNFNTNFTNLSAYSNADPNVVAIASSARVMGLPTGTKTRVLGTNTFLASTRYYDEKSNVIQILEDNIKSGTDISTVQYHFDGRALSECVDHTTPGTGYTNYKILSKNVFDQIGRIASVQKQFGSNAFKTISAIGYDDLGRLKDKRLDPSYIAGGNSGLESLGYTYNIHNQLTGINKDYALKTPGQYNKWEHFFGMYLGFDNRDNVFTSSNLLGKITGQLWSTLGDDAQRRYDYNYDNAGRVTSAAFLEKKTPGDTWSNAKMDFSVNGNGGKITYDLNGNLLNMLQKGVVAGDAAPTIIDNLSYTYAAYSNRLEKVTDNMSNTAVNGAFGDFKDGGNGAGNDYVFDFNGNIVIDLNKNVKELGGVVNANGIKYNFLDKPEEIRIAGKGTIQIVYSADGEKLQRLFLPEPGGPVVTTSYVNQFVYEESSAGGGANLQYIDFGEGRLRIVTPVLQINTMDMLTIDGNIDMPNGKRGVFDYYIKDHLQNVRMMLTEEIYQAWNTCSMETAGGRNTLEEAIFGQTGSNNEVTATRFTKPGGWSGNTSAFVSRIGTLAGRNVGPNVLQKVMAGDFVAANANYYYELSAGGNSANIVSAVAAGLLQAIGGSASTTSLVKGNANAITSQLESLGTFGTAVQPNGSSPSGTTPQAFITILFFDERFNLVEAGNGITQRQVDASVGATGKAFDVSAKAPKNGYVYVYVSNQSNNHVYFDDFKVSITAGNIVEENHYYTYGLKISTLSSRKYSNSGQGHVKNNFQMQGTFGEMDDDIGWNDFYLRNYDPQIGRWIQSDPYDQFASPYCGMGGDPVNAVDPSGGVSLPVGGVSTGLSTTAATAITLGEVVVRSSRVAVNAMTSVRFVSQVTLALSKVVTIANVINTSLLTLPAGTPSVGTNVVPESGGTGFGKWAPLYKSDLIEMYKDRNNNKEPTEYDLGKFFESLIPTKSMVPGYPLKKNSKIFDDANDRNTMPDFTGDAMLSGYNLPIIRIEDALWVEVKQKGGGIYLSTVDGQIRGHIDNIAAKFSSLKLKYRRYDFRPKFVLVTTADVKTSSGIKTHIIQQNVAFEHIHAEFRKEMKAGKYVWEVRFTDVIWGW